jgi:Tol biopolymer transport system component
VASDGTQGDNYSAYGSISKNGRYIAFQSIADNLVSDDTNDVADVFFHDRKTGETTRVSVDSSGNQGNEASGDDGFLAVSGNGRVVVYASDATNLVTNDTNAVADIFHHDRRTGETTRVSVAGDGTQADDSSEHPAPSKNGNVIAFTSSATNLVAADTNGEPDVFVRDVKRGTTTRASVSSVGAEGNGASSEPTISRNGGVVAFRSAATDLVPNDHNDEIDIFVRDLKRGTTTRVSVASDGTEANGASSSAAISANGRAVIFISEASNLVPGDTNGVADVFVHDLMTGETVRVDVDSAGLQSTGDLGTGLGLSRNGRRATFASDAADLVAGDTNGEYDVFVHDVR